MKNIHSFRKIVAIKNIVFFIIVLFYILISLNYNKITLSPFSSISTLVFLIYPIASSFQMFKLTTNSDVFKEHNHTFIFIFSCLTLLHILALTSLYVEMFQGGESGFGVGVLALSSVIQHAILKWKK